MTEDPEPSPFFSGTRKKHAVCIVYPVSVVNSTNAVEVHENRFLQLLRKECLPVFVPLSRPYGQAVPVVIDVLDPQHQAFCEAQTSAIDNLCHQLADTLLIRKTVYRLPFSKEPQEAFYESST